jgi:hypothetical protein
MNDLTCTPTATFDGELSLRSRLLTARSCIASARWALVEASTATKQKVRNSKVDYAAMCLLKAAQEIRRG